MGSSDRYFHEVTMNEALNRWNRERQEPRPIVDWQAIQEQRDYHAREVARLDEKLSERLKEGK